jgi:kynurenine formamidase
VIENGTVSHRGLPAPIICDYLSRESSRTRYAPGTEFHIAKIEMVANTGTYVDCPFHRFADGSDFSQIGVEQFADLDAIVVRADCAIRRKSASTISAAWKSATAQCSCTPAGIGTGTRPEYLGEHPFLTEDAANHLRDCGVKLVASIR